jgi:hypothetical protein
MYPPGMMQSPFGYGYHNAFNNPFPSFLPPESTPNVAAAATHNPTPSSPVSVGSDPVKRLESYLRWHIQRTPDRTDSFLRALEALNEREYEFCDIKTITDEEWTRMEIKKGISKVLMRNMKEFTKWLRFKNKENETTSGSASSDEATGEII